MFAIKNERGDRMQQEYKNIKEELVKRQIKPSHQRIKVLEYLQQHRCHPTVDQIYQALKQEIPTLSKATIYNTLKAFEEVQLVRTITIEDSEGRYDINTDHHGHFKCQFCDKIYDFRIDIDLDEIEDLKGFDIIEKDINFKGICPRCR